MARGVEVIIGVRTKMSCPPWAAYETATDVGNTSMIPGEWKGRLIDGDDQQPGSKYECVGNLHGVSGKIVFKTTEAKPPNSIKTRLVSAELSELKFGGVVGGIIGGIIVNGANLEDGATKWSFFEREYGCRAILTMIIKFGGLITALPYVKESLKEMIIKEAVIMVKNVKMGAEHHYTSIL